jgi:hypothetical protein
MNALVVLIQSQSESQTRTMQMMATSIEQQLRMRNKMRYLHIGVGTHADCIKQLQWKSFPKIVIAEEAVFNSTEHKAAYIKAGAVEVFKYSSSIDTLADQIDTIVQDFLAKNK